MSELPGFSWRLIGNIGTKEVRLTPLKNAPRYTVDGERANRPVFGPALVIPRSTLSGAFRQESIEEVAYILKAEGGPKATSAEDYAQTPDGRAQKTT